MRILFTCSSGGHLEELLQLKKIIKENESYLLTEANQLKKETFNRIFTVKQINRKEKFFFLHFIELIFYSFFVYKKIKPDVIISTGALVTVPISIIAKLFHKKVIYIESFARIYKPSLTGKIMYKFADVFIVQWKELLKYFPRAKYFGGIF
ncbi:polysaccharide biosynthesis protein [Lactobacillus crispatus]|uniref:PssD/Cps14F family polysaccharide biosynthesis glycosyltransferase n=1 Tax=Lactobacillus crispatus TaxID=47770 RepID=UPI0018E35707|nr:PssD/Cps14F family polysaccharide biosynthesis glycosyltransferase [Lactobacillus crispatus]MBI1694381.1 polysaccharide biosynthesis protein [Lactobacillus crispatus]